MDWLGGMLRGILFFGCRSLFTSKLSELGFLDLGINGLVGGNAARYIIFWMS